MDRAGGALGWVFCRRRGPGFEKLAQHLFISEPSAAQNAPRSGFFSPESSRFSSNGRKGDSRGRARFPDSSSRKQTWEFQAEAANCARFNIYAGAVSDKQGVLPGKRSGAGRGVDPPAPPGDRLRQPNEKRSNYGVCLQHAAWAGPRGGRRENQTLCFAFAEGFPKARFSASTFVGYCGGRLARRRRRTSAARFRCRPGAAGTRAGSGLPIIMLDVTGRAEGLLRRRGFP